MTGIELIAIERREQIEKHGHDHDSEYEDQLREAAIYCITEDFNYYPKSWNLWFYDKIEAKRNRLSKNDFKIEMNKIAAALLAADIDRIQESLQ